MTPVLIKNLMNKSEQTTDILSPIPLDTPPDNEDWLQDLIHNHPNLVPAGEVEACFENIIPILREFTVPSGYLDNFYVTPDGYPVLVEVKLWKNQESRRKVVAQILEYAKDFSGMAYETINKEIRTQYKDRAWGENPLYELVSENSPTVDSEQVFVNRVTRNLKEGRFLLLILGDGIREDMAALAEHLIQHSLRYAFGIIQVQLFKLPDGSVVALPSVVAKTQTIERHVTVVTTKDNGIQINLEMPVISERTEKTSLSLDKFYNQMEKINPQGLNAIKAIIQKITELPIECVVGSNNEQIILKARLSNGDQISLIHIGLKTVAFWGVQSRLRKNQEWQKIARSYLDRIVAVISGSFVKVWDSGSYDIRYNDKEMPIVLLQNHEAELVDIMMRVLQEANAFYENESNMQY